MWFLVDSKCILEKTNFLIDYEINREEFPQVWVDDEDVNCHVMGFELKSDRSIEGVSKALKRF